MQPSLTRTKYPVPEHPLEPIGEIRERFWTPTRPNPRQLQVLSFASIIPLYCPIGQLKIVRDGAHMNSGPAALGIILNPLTDSIPAGFDVELPAWAACQ